MFPPSSGVAVASVAATRILLSSLAGRRLAVYPPDSPASSLPVGQAAVRLPLPKRHSLLGYPTSRLAKSRGKFLAARHEWMEEPQVESSIPTGVAH